ncbi:MAG TPA: MGMT family protein [Candidatus Norongarragalinales archaeon]|nr:MGMT family protein [Candidatus Norongarragalinales archaeon]
MRISSFKARVYSAARRVPKGKVATYKAIAIVAGKSKAMRAVGNIMHHNDISHTGVPCHRIIKSSGEVGGFAHGTKKKVALLLSEGVRVMNGKVDLTKFAHRFR